MKCITQFIIFFFNFGVVGIKEDKSESKIAMVT